MGSFPATCNDPQEKVVIPMSGEIKVTSVKRTSSAHVVTY